MPSYEIASSEQMVLEGIVLTPEKIPISTGEQNNHRDGDDFGGRYGKYFTCQDASVVVKQMVAFIQKGLVVLLYLILLQLS